MGKPTIRILGAYQVELTEDLFRHAMESKYGGLELSKSQAMQTERYVREELSSVALFEVTGSCPYHHFRKCPKGCSPWCPTSRSARHRVLG